MRVLTLDRSGRLCFRERSSLPVSAACVVASGMRERLAALLRESVALRLLEPTIPTPRGWAAITGGARLYRVRGVISDAAVVLRSLDAAALARAAFGETVDPSACKRELSAIEIQVLDRAIASLAGALSAVCGPPEGESTAELVGEIAGFATYFELVLDRPVDARIGIALAREPVAQAHGHLEIEDLREVELAVHAAVELGNVAAIVLAALAPGDLVPITGGAFRGSLHAGGRTLARGICGVRNGHYALAIEGGETV